MKRLKSFGDKESSCRWRRCTDRPCLITVQAEQDELEEAELHRAEREHQEKQIRHSRALRAQYKAILLRKSKEVQEALVEDLNLLDMLAAGAQRDRILKTERCVFRYRRCSHPTRRKAAMEQMEAVREETEAQLQLERERAAALDRLYRLAGLYCIALH